MAVKTMKMFWVVTPYRLVGRYQRFGEKYFSPEEGDSMFLRNVHIYLLVYKASHPRRQPSSYSSL
jgi:hypothetical protein